MLQGTNYCLVDETKINAKKIRFETFFSFTSLFQKQQ